MRSDTRRNRRRLLEAAAELVHEHPQSLTLANVAARAEIGVATAYRYFSSVEELLHAVAQATADDFLAFALECDVEGAARFDALMMQWVTQMSDDRGLVMVQLRSREGFVSRLNRGEELIATVAQAWGQAVGELLEELGIGSARTPEALMLLNVLTDPREIWDMRSTLGMEGERIATTLASTFRAALGAWMHSSNERCSD